MRIVFWPVKTLRRRISDETVRGNRIGRLVDINDLLENLVEEIPTVGGEG